MAYTKAFEEAINHAMREEVGPNWKLTAEAQAGLISTRAQRSAVGYVNDPVDRGGETKYGIAKNANPNLNIATLNWEQAKGVYYKNYWLSGSCHKLPARLAVLHLDGCINHGPGRANTFLQRAVGVPSDGAIGPVTLAAVDKYTELSICKSICDQREYFYKAIIRNDPKQIKFLKGWMGRIERIRALVLDPKKSFD